MFVKKLVENVRDITDKATKKPAGGNPDGLKSSDVDPHLVFHYGIPSGASNFAYHAVQSILAVATRDGRIKLFGKGNTQTLLQSHEPVSTKFIQFVQNKGILLNVTSKNQIEVWDVDKKFLSHVHGFKEDITSFTVMAHCPYIYVGDSLGNVSVLKLGDQEPCHLLRMRYTIPFSASHGIPTEASVDSAVVHILPQPMAESKRVLIAFEDGLITLWDIRESKSIFTTGGSLLQSQHHETKKVTSACWACSFGSKVAVGYSNGEIFIWSIPTTANLRTELTSESSTQSGPLSKLNLGYKLDKIPIAALKWLQADGKASRLYVMGAADVVSMNLLQVILLNEHTETRIIKLGLHLSEPCFDMGCISSSCDQSKHQQDSLLVLGKSGQIYAYDDCLIEKYLLQSQSKSSPSLPKELKVKMPFAVSNITVAKFITDNQCMLSAGDEDYIQLAKSIPSLFPFEAKPSDGTPMNAVQFSGFTKVKNLYITGHGDGGINFWDVSCPFLIPILSLKQQSEDDFSSSGVTLTALYFDGNSRLLVSGDQSGMVRICKFKPEPYSTENSFMPFQGSSRKGNSHIVQSVKHMKVNGSILSINISQSSGHLAVGSEQGYVSVIDMEGPTLLYEKHIASEISTGIISLQFETCNVHGFEKNVLMVATKDSYLFALDANNGSILSANPVHPKQPSRALFMQILDGQDMSTRGLNMPSNSDPSKGKSVDDGAKQPFLLICSEKAVYVYSLNHAIQGVKKVNYKKKFHSSSCCWASTFYSASSIGLILLLSTGKIEIRSLPDLSLIKESSVRGFQYSLPKLNSLSDSSICCSGDGKLVMVNGDQEMFVVSVVLESENFRLLDSVSQVYRKDLMLSQQGLGGLGSGSMVQREKKKGIFSTVIKDIKGSKPKQVPEAELEDTKESIEELSTIFSFANFQLDAENKDSMTTDDGGINLDDLDIDDIDIGDPEEKPKDKNILAALNKQNLTSKFQAFKGKIKQMKVKNEKNIKEEEQEEKMSGRVDQIKKRYGYSPSGESTSAAKMAESKLQENWNKLQGIHLKTTEMQDTARSFSAMAKDVLQTAEKDRRRSS